jgi:MOSC domain-containing protein YiiM
MGSDHGAVVAVHRSATHTFSKPTVERITLLAGLGVDGDAHSGTTVKHRSRVAADPTQPNLRQVHLIQSELHDDLRAQGYEVAYGQMGENITTRGVDVLALPTGTRLHLGEDAVVEVTGLRNPCRQLNGIADGLLAQVRIVDDDGRVVSKTGVMGIVVEGGDVRPGDAIRVELPAIPHSPLQRV